MARYHPATTAACPPGAAQRVELVRARKDRGNSLYPKPALYNCTIPTLHRPPGAAERVELVDEDDGAAQHLGGVEHVGQQVLALCTRVWWGGRQRERYK